MDEVEEEHEERRDGSEKRGKLPQLLQHRRGNTHTSR